MTRAPGLRRAERALNRFSASLERKLPRGAGTFAAMAVIASGIGYGLILGDHAGVVHEQLADARDSIANAAGFQITSIALSGEKQLTREEILDIAGVTGRSSLLFLNADEARTRLKANPWIADATILKLFPDRLHISVTERNAFALWQKDGRVQVVSRDGTVVEPFVAPHVAHLPLVVGKGANERAADFLAVMDNYPALLGQVRAYILVADRRWNLKLKNGIDVRLPEADPVTAIASLIALDKDKQILSRDITALDLRIHDRVTIRLSDAAAAARAEALKSKTTPKRKGSDA